MNAITRGVAFTDLLFQGRSRVIATAVLHSHGSVTLVDPGPASSLTTLRESLARHGMPVADVRAILLTHIHLDHAGATGTLVRDNPKIDVFVHERGARHMADPARLLESATRLYGEDMNRLWGEFVPVPAANLRSLAGGERLTVGDRQFEVAYTPGHALHHVSYFDRASGIAFVGDVAGIRTGPELFAMPPTPPPDIDLDAWASSVECIERWQPDTLFVTHFGPHGGVPNHLQTLLQHLGEMSRLVRRTLDDDGSDADRMARFGEEMRRYLRQHLSEAEAVRYDHAAPLWLCWLGLARYWRKRASVRRNEAPS